MNRSLIALTVAALALSFGACASTPDKTAPKPVAKKATHSFPVLTWDQVAAALKKGAILVDSRGPKSYARGHIPGSVNGPCRDHAQLKRVLPKDKSRLVIFYCGGPKCAASAKSAAFAVSLGHTRVAEYKAGYPDWVARTKPTP